VFALGDVAASKSPKMARAAFAQAEVVASNINQLIYGKVTQAEKSSLTSYVPDPIEGTITMTLGAARIFIGSRI